MPPRFLRQPSGVTALVNSDVELECEVYASPPARVEWLKNGDMVIASDYFQVIDGRNLRILGLVESDEGMYQCTATNNAGMIQASARLVISQTSKCKTNVELPSKNEYGNLMESNLMQSVHITFPQPFSCVN